MCFYGIDTRKESKNIGSLEYVVWSDNRQFAITVTCEIRVAISHMSEIFIAHAGFVVSNYSVSQSLSDVV
jgi:hypothetical protein